MTPAGRTALAALLLAAGVNGSAQTPAPERPGGFHVGPFYLTPRLDLKNAGVDTNVFNSEANAVPDTSVVLSPGLDVVLPVRDRLRLKGNGYLDLNYFRRSRGEQSVDFGGSGQADLIVGPFTFFGGGGGSQAKGRFAIDIDQRILHQNRNVQGGVILKLTQRLNITARGSQDVLRFESTLLDGFDVANALDRNTLTGTTQLRFALTHSTNLLGSGDLIADKFRFVEPGQTRDARSYRVAGGVEFGPGALIQGSVVAGIRDFPQSATVSSYRGPYLAAQTEVPLPLNLKLKLAATKDVKYTVSRLSVGEGRLRHTYASSQYSGELGIGLPLDLILQGRASFEEGRFLVPQDLNGVATRRVDHRYILGGSLLRAFSPTIRVGGTFAWERRVSTFPRTSYEGLRYGVQAQVAP